MENWVLQLLIAVGIAAGFIVGNYLFLSSKGRHGFPPYTPPPAPPEREQWWPLKVDELQPGRFYRCRLSKLPVLTLRLGIGARDNSPKVMVCKMWNHVTGCYDQLGFRDDELETDKPVYAYEDWKGGRRPVQKPPSAEELMKAVYGKPKG